MDKIFKADTGILDRLKQTGELNWQKYAQTNPDVTRFLALREGTLAPIIRAFGEKGTLNEGDIKRAYSMWPVIGPISDSREVAQAKIAQLKELFNQSLKPGISLDQALNQILTKEKPKPKSNIDELLKKYGKP